MARTEAVKNCLGALDFGTNKRNLVKRNALRLGDVEWLLPIQTPSLETVLKLNLGELDVFHVMNAQSLDNGRRGVICGSN